MGTLTITKEQVDYNPDLVVDFPDEYIHYKYNVSDGKNSVDLFGSVPLESKKHYTLDQILNSYLYEMGVLHNCDLDFETWKGKRFDIWDKNISQELHMRLYSRYKCHLKQHRKFTETFGIDDWQSESDYIDGDCRECQ